MSVRRLNVNTRIALAALALVSSKQGEFLTNDTIKIEVNEDSAIWTQPPNYAKYSSKTNGKRKRNPNRWR